MRRWAVEAGLEEATADALVAHKVDGQALLELTTEEIKEIVPTMGPRKALQRAQRELRQSARAGPTSADGEWAELPDASVDQPVDGTATEEQPKPEVDPGAKQPLAVRRSHSHLCSQSTMGVCSTRTRSSKFSIIRAMQRDTRSLPTTILIESS